MEEEEEEEEERGGVVVREARADLAQLAVFLSLLHLFEDLRPIVS